MEQDPTDDDTKSMGEFRERNLAASHERGGVRTTTTPIDPALAAALGLSDVHPDGGGSKPEEGEPQ